MNIAMILSVVTLLVSVAITVFRLIEWLVRINPVVLMSVARKAIWVATIASVPCLILAIIYEQWTLAAVLAVIMLVTPTIGNWRSIVFGAPGRFAFAQGGPLVPAYDESFVQPIPDPELVRRAATILEDYVAAAGQPALGFDKKPDALGRPESADTSPYADPMSLDEARDVLGLNPRATAAEIEFAHRRLIMLVHPDRGGTNYLAVKINRAKDTLLANASAAEPRLL